MTEEQPATVDGRRARWTRHNEERRQHVLDAAIAVIEREGSADLHVQQIAEAAGMSRTVVYRHFEDRADLDEAIQGEILGRISREVMAAAVLEGSALHIITRIVAAYVAWADAHPVLHRIAERDQSQSGHQAARLADEMTSTLTHLVTTIADQVGVRLTEVEAQALPLMVGGLLGFVHTTVHEWLRQEPRVPSADALTHLVAESLWHMVGGHLRRKGSRLGPDDELAGQLAKRRHGDT